MKRKFYLIAALCSLFTIGAFAQESSEGRNSFEGSDRPVYTIELNESEADAKEAFLDYMKTTANVKGSYKKGIYKFTGVVIPAVSAEKLDYYATINRKSKKEKDISVVNFYVSKGYDNYVSSKSDATIGAAALAFTTGLAAHAVKFRHGVNFANQDKKVNKEQQKLKDLEAKVAKQEKELEKTKSQLESQRKSVEKETGILGTLKKLL